MQSTLKVKISSPSKGMANAPRSTRLACRCQLSSSRLASAPVQQQQSCISSSDAIEKASLALAASMLPLATALPAFADETAAPATDAAAAVTTAQPIIFGMTAFDLGVSFTPVLVYALFTLYRNKINPRAKFGDLIFIIAALVVFGNIFSVLIFKKRLY